MIIIPLFVIVPLAGAFLISLGKRFKELSVFISSFCGFSLLLLSLYCINLTKGTSVFVYKLGGWIPPIGIALVLDGLTTFMLLTVNLIAFIIVLFSIDYMKQYTARWNFFCLFLLMLAGMNGVIITGDLFNLYVFLEIASVASYALVAFGTEHEELEASFKYIVMSSVGSLFILLGIGLIYSFTSTLNMADIAFILTTKGANKIILFVSVLFIMGFGLKAALVPFHAWLPDAHPAAPAPISAMLSGVLIKTLGIYALMRILFNVFGMTIYLSKALMFLAVLSMLVGIFLAIGQWDFKRLLAYSSISQVGFIMLAIALGTPLGILAGLFHLFNHSIFKSLLFLNSGAVQYSTGTRNMKELGGLRRKLPTTASTCLVGSMAISGIPPFNGFWSKLLIIIACIQAQRVGFAIWAILDSILTLVAFTKVQRYVFFGKLSEKFNQIKEVPILMRVSMLFLALICIFGAILLIPAIADNFLSPAVNALLDGQGYAVKAFEAIR